MTAIIRQRFQDLVDAAAVATAADPATVAKVSAVASLADNLVLPDDGFERIEFDSDVGDVEFVVSYDQSTNIMTLRNLRDGSEDQVDLTGSLILATSTQTARFDGAGATITLNSAFDKSASMNNGFSALSVGGTADFDFGSGLVVSAIGSAAEFVTSTSLVFDATASDSATISIGDFTAEGVDLSERGSKTVELTNSADSFEISFSVTTAFSDGDDAAFEIGELGRLLIARVERGTPPVDNVLDATLASSTALNGQAAQTNLLETADGFDSIDLGAASGGDVALVVAYDAASGLLSLRNLTTGVVEAVDVDSATPVPTGGTQGVTFVSLGANITLNDAFDKTANLGATSLVVTSGGGQIDADSIAITSASGSGAQTLTTASIVIDVGRAMSAVISIGDFETSTGVDLATTGTKVAVLTDDTDAFEISFDVTTAFSHGDDGFIELGAFGQLVFRDVSAPETVVGTAGNDSFTGTVFGEIVKGGGGDDALDGGSGDDTLIGHSGIDFLDGGAGDDFLLGGDGDDVLEALVGDNRIVGGAGNDAIRGGEVDVIFGGDGDDVILAGSGADAALGGEGADNIDGGEGDDRLYGGAGIDTIHGAAGDDVIRGGDDADTLNGGLGADIIRGDGGDDVIAGGERWHDDILYGDAGLDTIDGGSGDDLIRGGDGADILEGGYGDDVVLGEGDNDVITGGAGSGDDRLYGGDGDDQVDGGYGDDLIRGGDGADILAGGVGYGDDVILGEGGDDVISSGEGRGRDRLYGGDGDDRITGGLGIDLLRGGDGADILAGGDDDDVILGEGGDDVISGGENRDRLFGGVDNDTLDGGSDNDALFGEAGADVISGGVGFDVLVGGAGADRFRFLVGAEVERIADFEDGVDLIDMSGHGGVNSFADVVVRQAGANVKIIEAADRASADFIVLVGFDATNVSAADFVF